MRQARFFTKRPGACSHCEHELPVGSRVHLNAAYIRCLECGPFPLPHGTVTTIAPGIAEGAEDSSKASLKAASGRGKALRSGVPATPSKPTKRRRLPSATRRARQR